MEKSPPTLLSELYSRSQKSPKTEVRKQASPKKKKKNNKNKRKRTIPTEIEFKDTESPKYRVAAASPKTRIKLQKEQPNNNENNNKIKSATHFRYETTACVLERARVQCVLSSGIESVARQRRHREYVERIVRL